MQSPKFSFKGWSFWKWLIGNWKTIKEVGKVVVPYLIARIFAGDLAAQGAITILGKGVLDAVEYYLKEYK